MSKVEARGSVVSVVLKALYYKPEATGPRLDGMNYFFQFT
jgi:hypothetical protein